MILHQVSIQTSLHKMGKYKKRWSVCRDVHGRWKEMEQSEKEKLAESGGKKVILLIIWFIKNKKKKKGKSRLLTDVDFCLFIPLNTFISYDAV